MDDGLPTRISSRSEFGAALQAVLEDAAATGARELWLTDADFAAWPIDAPGFLQPLTSWARAPGRRITLVARDFAEMPRRHPRFVEWRRTWNHVVSARAVPELDASQMPTLLLAGGALGVQLLDRDHWHGRWFRDENDWRTWREVIDALLQRSEEAFPATVLGI